MQIKKLKKLFNCAYSRGWHYVDFVCSKNMRVRALKLYKRSNFRGDLLSADSKQELRERLDNYMFDLVSRNDYD